MEVNEIYAQARAAIEEVCAQNRPGFNPVGLLVVGCSSSEIAGGTIGHDSTYEYGEAVAQAALDAAREGEFEVAFQCCEHLNRALVVERATAERMRLNIVWAVPRKKAGGSLATAGWKAMHHPVLAERICADAGIDIGNTLIGMHLRRVAVPVRLENHAVGCAPVVAARTRPCLIGGERAAYTEED